MNPNNYSVESPGRRSNSFWDVAKVAAALLLGLAAAFNWFCWYIYAHPIPQWGIVVMWVAWFVSMPTSMALVITYRRHKYDIREEWRADRADLLEETHRLRQEVQAMAQIASHRVSVAHEPNRSRGKIANATVITDADLSDEEIIDQLAAELPDTTLRTLRARREKYKARKKVAMQILNWEKAWTRRKAPDTVTYSQIGEAKKGEVPSPTRLWKVG